MTLKQRSSLQSCDELSGPGIIYHCCIHTTAPEHPRIVVHEQRSLVMMLLSLLYLLAHAELVAVNSDNMMSYRMHAIMQKV